MKSNPPDTLISELSEARPMTTANKRLFYKREELKGASYHGPKFNSTDSDEMENDRPLDDDKNQPKREIRLTEMEIQAIISPLTSYSSAVGKVCPPHLQRTNRRESHHDDPRSSQA
jgi:hypothetical protein